MVTSALFTEDYYMYRIFIKKIDYIINVIDHIGVQMHGFGMQMLSSTFKYNSISTILQLIIFCIDDILCIVYYNYIANIFHILTFFLIFIYSFFNTFGFDAFYNIFYFSGMISYIIGGIFYVTKYPSSNKYWGFHELYHLFVGIGDVIFFYDAYISGNF